MTGRWARISPLLVAAASLAWFSGLPTAPAVVIAILAGSAIFEWRAPLDFATQRLSAVVIAMLVIAGVRAAELPVMGPGLRSVAFGVALAPLCVAAARQWLNDAEGGRRIDLGLAMVTLLACGSARPGLGYGVMTVAFVAAVAVSARAGDDARPALSTLPRRAWAVGGLVVAVAAVGVTAFAAASIPAAKYVEDRFNRMMTDRWASRTGFTDSVRFGRITKLIASRTVVMRLTGPRVTHLRGVALDRYDDERWTRANREPMASVAVALGRPEGADVVEIRPVRTDGERLFLPLDMTALATSNGAVSADSFGVVRHPPTPRAPTVWFRLGPRDLIPVAPPQPTDLQVPPALRAPLAKLAAEWVGDRTSPDDMLAAIQAKLLDGSFAYSADYVRRTRADAVAEFLFVAKKGHCEVFASAMALVARSAGVPARLVVGYRVAERNPLFSHWVVRESNAHAWVEAQVADGTWRTFDPTPMSDLPQDVTHDEGGVDAWTESLATLWSRTEDWLAERTVVEFGGAAALGLVAFAALRWRRLRRAGGAPVSKDAGFSTPLAAFTNLEHRLRAKGFGRRRSETLEQWAKRLPDAALAAVLIAYAAHRYGDPTNPDQIARDLDVAAASVDALTPAPADR